MPSFNFTTSKGTHNETYIELQINFCCRVLDSVSLKKLIMCVCVCVCLVARDLRNQDRLEEM
jgi:hypothetical protein